MTDVMEQEQTTTRKPQRPLTDDQKKAAGMRREASLLKKYGHNDEAAKLEAQATLLAPASKQGRPDPLKVLTAEEQKALRDYFRTTQGFARLAQVVSAKKLQEIASELG